MQSVAKISQGSASAYCKHWPMYHWIPSPMPSWRSCVSPAKGSFSDSATGSRTAMTVARFPQLAHWGAFTALVEDGRVVGCEPFARDPAPSNMLDAIPERGPSPWRIARPAIRDGWREGKERTGADRFHEVSWDEALAAVASELARVRETFGHASILGGS